MHFIQISDGLYFNDNFFFYEDIRYIFSNQMILIAYFNWDLFFSF